MIKLETILNEIQIKGNITSEQLLKLYYQKLREIKSLVNELPYYKLFKMKKFKEFEKLVFKHYPNPMNLGGSHPFDQEGSPSMESFEKVIHTLTPSQLTKFYIDLSKFHL